MSQYAYIPANRIEDVHLDYSIASPSSWTFDKDGHSYGGFEEVIFSPSQRNEIETLGGECFDDGTAFYAWLNGGTQMAQVIRDRQFGQLMINKYLSKNKTLELTVDQSLEQLTKFANIKALLEVGAIRPALTLIQSVVIDSVYTQPRKDEDIAAIQEYLG